MKLAISFVLIILIAILILQNQLVVAAIFVAVFTWRDSAAWLIVVGVCIDAYFGAFATWPMFSIGATAWWLLSEYIKPRLLVQ